MFLESESYALIGVLSKKEQFFQKESFILFLKVCKEAHGRCRPQPPGQTLVRPHRGRQEYPSLRGGGRTLLCMIVMRMSFCGFLTIMALFLAF